MGKGEDTGSGPIQKKKKNHSGWLEEATVDAGEQLGQEMMVYFTRMMQDMTRNKQN